MVFMTIQIISLLLIVITDRLGNKDGYMLVDTSESDEPDIIISSSTEA